MRGHWQVDWRNLKGRTSDRCRHARNDRVIFRWCAIVAANKQVCGRVRFGIKSTDQSVLFYVGFAGQSVGSHVMRLEKCAEAIVILLRDRIVLVLVAARTIQR